MFPGLHKKEKAESMAQQGEPDPEESVGGSQPNAKNLDETDDHDISSSKSIQSISQPSAVASNPSSQNVIRIKFIDGNVS